MSPNWVCFANAVLQISCQLARVHLAQTTCTVLYCLSVAADFVVMTRVYAGTPVRQHTGASRGASAYDVLRVAMYGDSSDIDTNSRSSNIGSECDAEMQQPALGVLQVKAAEEEREPVMLAALQAAPDNDGAQLRSQASVAGGETDGDDVQLAAGTTADDAAPPAQHDVQHNTDWHRVAVGQRGKRTARLDALAEGAAGKQAGDGAQHALANRGNANDAVSAAQNGTRRNAGAQHAGVSLQQELRVHADGSAQPLRLTDGLADALVPGIHARSPTPPAQHDARHAADNAHAACAADDVHSEAQHVPAPDANAGNAAPPVEQAAPRSAGDDHAADGLDDDGVPDNVGGAQLELAPGGHADNAARAAAHKPQQHAPAGNGDVDASQGALHQGFRAKGNAAGDRAAGSMAVAPAQQGAQPCFCCMTLAVEQQLNQLCAACWEALGMNVQSL